jgi:hypothetical protein
VWGWNAKVDAKSEGVDVRECDVAFGGDGVEEGYEGFELGVADCGC